MDLANAITVMIAIAIGSASHSLMTTWVFRNVGSKPSPGFISVVWFILYSLALLPGDFALQHFFSAFIGCVFAFWRIKRFNERSSPKAARYF